MTDTLNRDDILALRSADSVSFHVRPGVAPYVRASVDARRYDGSPVILTESAQRVFGTLDDYGTRYRDITVDATVRGYAENGGTWHGGESATCFDMITAPRYADRWQTIVATLRAGESLTLRFRYVRACHYAEGWQRRDARVRSTGVLDARQYRPHGQAQRDDRSHPLVSLSPGRE
jgi:hypothetical protein